jgi:hypothetical protein
VEIFYEIDDYKEMALLYNSRKIPPNLAMKPSLPGPFMGD